MFDLIVNGQRNTAPRDIAPLAISWAVHTLGIGAVVILPLLFATDHLPVAPKEILTHVTVAAPPPPPPAAPAPAPAVKRPSPRPAPTREADAAGTGGGRSRASALHPGGR